MATASYQSTQLANQILGAKLGPAALGLIVPMRGGKVHGIFMEPTEPFPILLREVARHELPETERVCAHDGAVLVEIGSGISEQFDIGP